MGFRASGSGFRGGSGAGRVLSSPSRTAVGYRVVGEGGSTVPNYIALLVLCFYGAFLNLCGFYGWTLALLCGIFRSKRW